MKTQQVAEPMISELLTDELLNKARYEMFKGNLNPMHLYHFVRMSPREREEWCNYLSAPARRPIRSTDKFRLLIDLGVLDVPEYYDRANYLADFRRMFYGGEKKLFRNMNDAITDGNFCAPGRVLRPGDKLRVRVYHQTSDGHTDYADRFAFLENRNAVYPGAHGLALLFADRTMRRLLPRGYQYQSFDERRRLVKYTISSSLRRIPAMWIREVDCGDVFDFVLGYMDGSFDSSHAFVCFTEVHG